MKNQRSITSPHLEVSAFRAYAKINLGLFVHEKRPDGYHNIETVFHRINLFDEITFTALNVIRVESSSQEAPGNESNICFKAAHLVQRQLRVNTGVTISIQKNIPVGAGLGGGSSDAAVVLRSLPAFWGATLPEDVLVSLGLQLGSDVPYFLHKGSAFAKGRGELLEYFTLDIPHFILLCNPGIHISTAWAYQRVTPSGPERERDLRRLLIQGMTDPEYFKQVRNDFEPAVFETHPEVAQIREVMVECGAVFARMSGSGSSVYGLFPSRGEGETAAGILRQRGYFTCLTNPGFHTD